MYELYALYRFHLEKKRDIPNIGAGIQKYGTG